MITKDINPAKIVEINIHDRIESSFPVLDVFVQVACFISRGGNLGVIGKEINGYKEMTEIQPKISQDQKLITGGVIYIDNYGNVISNISRKLFTEIGKGRDFKVSAGRYNFTKVFNKYNEIINPDATDTKQFHGNRLAIFNSAGYLEIAIYRSNLKTVGGASTLLGLDYRDIVTIEFL
jgi:S-adenosylmethionine hydrolase